MSVMTTAERPVKKWRVIVFGVVAGLFALFFLVFSLGVPLLVLSLFPSAPVPFPATEHWHLAMLGVYMGLLFGVNMVVLLWHGERRPALAQFFLLSWLGLAVMSVVTSPDGFLNSANLLGIGLLAIFILAYPRPRTLFSFKREGSWVLPLLALSILAAICLAPDVWKSIGSAAGLTNPTDRTGWVAAAIVDVLLVLGGILASTRRPGWKALSILLGVSLLYLGVAALILPTNAGSWGIIGSILGMLGGAGFIAATFYEQRRTKQVAQVPTTEAK